MRVRCFRGGLRVGLAGLAALWLSACLNVQFLGGPPEPLVEKVVFGETGPKILLLKIDGVISMRAPEPRLLGFPGDSLVSRVREVLDRAREDPEVRALLVRIDSPGGTATASDVVYGEILRFKKERGIPVVAHLVGTATSGGYYVAMASDVIIANPTAVTGSIGVLFLSVNFAGLMEKLGIEDQTLTAGSHKDAGSPLRRMTPEERAHIQSVLKDLLARFEEVVVAGRPGLGRDRVLSLADGRIFSASQARTHGLVDELGDLERAVAVARQKAGLESAQVVVYHRPAEYENNLLTRAPATPVLKLELPEPLGWLGRPGFYYLWVLGLQ